MRTGFVGLMTAGLIVWVTTVAATSRSYQGNAEAAKLVSPIAATTDSIAAGQKVYQRYCRVCHGPEGKGGRKLEEGPAASNLADSAWDHGSTDGEIFYVIKNGVPPEMVMAAWEDQINDTDIWNLVNYVRTLAPKP